MSVNSLKEETEIIRYWREIDAFQIQLRLTGGRPCFTFYDGPPFDYHVSRRFGWDTHGLPIEYEIDKRLGVSGHDAVMQMGIGNIERLGRWIDLEDDYKSMDLSFMESCLLGVPGKENTSLVIYTTTPWTIPSNLFIAVHPDFEYFEIPDVKTEKHYILLESGLSMF
ncbi:hypothetical protein MFIFM68171_05864 [Madurella fahalii]|uniref:Aminoacyl-tRNA synthetase class Ia domain-containing protein n=1 Tax=Madurella fahalii TaxID=1157608 RepID=A0ABQ0GD09_9PEZI